MHWGFIAVYGLLAVVYGLSLAAAWGFSCPAACGILVPQLRIKPASPALEGRFLTNGPPGKSLSFYFKNSQIVHINACVWNLERWHWWTYLQGSNGDADIEKRLWIQGEGGREGGREISWENSMETYTLLYIKQIASGNFLCDTGRSTQGSVTT